MTTPIVGSTALPYEYKLRTLASVAAGVHLPGFRLRHRGSKYQPHVGKKQLTKKAHKS